MLDKKFTFIGGGNMATALFVGLLNAKVPPQDIQVIDPDTNKLAELAQRYSVTCHAQANAQALLVDYIFLCVKPQIMQTVCAQLQPFVQTSPATIVSVAAGITTSHLRTWLQTSNPLIRCMPNTPALIGLGATGLFSADALSDAVKNELNAIFNGVGISIWTQQEEDIDSVTAISGSGPAYFFKIFEAMQTAAIELGLNEEDAKQLILQTALGAAQMAKASDLELSQLRENVTSKGGTTAAALASLADNQLDHIIQQAVQAAKQRSIELAK